jgi:ankyrin repeat protein
VLPLVFHFVCMCRQLDFAKALVQAGCDVAATDELGRTALVWAAKSDQTQILEWMLQQDEGQMMEARSRTHVRTEPCPMTVGNKTAFLFAYRKGAVQSAALLAEAGCDTAAHCAEGRYALMLASMGAHTGVVSFGSGTFAVVLCELAI